MARGQLELVVRVLVGVVVVLAVVLVLVLLLVVLVVVAVVVVVVGVVVLEVVVEAPPSHPVFFVVLVSAVCLPFQNWQFRDLQDAKNRPRTCKAAVPGSPRGRQGLERGGWKNISRKIWNGKVYPELVVLVLVLARVVVVVLVLVHMVVAVLVLVLEEVVVVVLVLALVVVAVVESSPSQACSFVVLVAVVFLPSQMWQFRDLQEARKCPRACKAAIPGSPRGRQGLERGAWKRSSRQVGSEMEKSNQSW